MARKKIQFEENSKNIEQAIKLLESGKLTLEESIACFEKTMSIIKENQQYLDAAKQKIDIITKNQ